MRLLQVRIPKDLREDDFGQFRLKRGECVEVRILKEIERRRRRGELRAAVRDKIENGHAAIRREMARAEGVA